MLYLAITQFLGFPKYGDEFKVMGLAPYGETDPSLTSCSQLVVGRCAPGQVRLDLSYFSHWTGGGDETWEDGDEL